MPEIRIRIGRLLLYCCPIENIWEIWPIKIDFGRPNAEIGRKMANGQQLFLALEIVITRSDEWSGLCHTIYWKGNLILRTRPIFSLL